MNNSLNNKQQQLVVLLHYQLLEYKSVYFCRKTLPSNKNEAFAFNTSPQTLPPQR